MRSRNFIGEFGPMLKAIVSGKESEYGAALRSAALLSFCKFMAISSSFCEANLSVRIVYKIKGSCCSRCWFAARMSGCDATL